MLQRILEPEVMDTIEDASDYDAMNHSAVNAKFAADFLSVYHGDGPVLDVGTGTAQIPIELARRHVSITIVAVDLADEMLRCGQHNVIKAGLSDRIRLEQANARMLPYSDGAFAAVISNSIIHHIPEPIDSLSEMVRVCTKGGRLFVRDLSRPGTKTELDYLVATYAGQENHHQRQLFANSLHAALTPGEVRDLVAAIGYDRESVRQTSDRHWTWTTTA